VSESIEGELREKLDRSKKVLRLSKDIIDTYREKCPKWKYLVTYWGQGLRHNMGIMIINGQKTPRAVKKAYDRANRIVKKHCDGWRYEFKKVPESDPKSAM
jgi:hypothetical protein